MPLKELTFESFCAKRVRETPQRGLERRKRCCGDDVVYGESMFESMCTRRDDKSLRRGPRKCKRRYRRSMFKISQLKDSWKTMVMMWNTGESMLNSMGTRRYPRKCKRMYRGGMWTKLLTTKEMRRGQGELNKIEVK